MSKAALDTLTRCVADIIEVEGRGERAVLARTDEGYRYMPDLNDLPGEVIRTDLGQGIIIEKKHLRTGVEYDVRHMGVSVRTMRNVGLVRNILFDVARLLIAQRDDARARLATSELARRRAAEAQRREIDQCNQRNAPIRTRPGASPPGTTGIGWPSPAIVTAYGIGVLSGAVVALITLLSQQG